MLITVSIDTLCLIFTWHVPLAKALIHVWLKFQQINNWTVIVNTESLVQFEILESFRKGIKAKELELQKWKSILSFRDFLASLQDDMFSFGKQTWHWWCTRKWTQCNIMKVWKVVKVKMSYKSNAVVMKDMVRHAQIKTMICKKHLSVVV